MLLIINKYCAYVFIRKIVEAKHDPTTVEFGIENPLLLSRLHSVNRCGEHLVNIHNHSSCVPTT
jgi:hypothetical protein